MLSHLNLVSELAQLDPRLKAPGFKTLIVKKDNIAFNLNLVFLSLHCYIHNGMRRVLIPHRNITVRRVQVDIRLTLG